MLNVELEEDDLYRTKLHAFELKLRLAAAAFYMTLIGNMQNMYSEILK